MAKCKNCRNLTSVEEYGEKYPWCDMLDDCPNIEFERDCPNFEKMSNADAIRNMTDEELAELFAQYSCEDSDYTSLLPIEECKWGTKQEVIKRNLQWLKSEVKE